ncbi:MAG: hypothetical protein ACFB21_14335 [Opitutales bacterium]
MPYPRCILLLLAVLAGAVAASMAEPYLSPFDLRASPDGSRLALSDATAARVILDPASAAPVAVGLRGSPRGLTWQGTDRVFVAEYDAGTVAEVDGDTGGIARRFLVGPKPVGVALAGNTLLVAGYGRGELHFIPLSPGGTTETLPLVKQPFFVAASPSGGKAAVGHLIPEVAATAANAAASVTLVDIPGRRVQARIRFPYGSSMVRQLAFSADGDWVYVLHTLGRIAMPTTQLERGWINTNALTIIDAGAGKIEATVLLDLVTRGGADPWGLALAPDGETAWVTLAGAHEVARIDLGKLHRLLDGTEPVEASSSYSGSAWEYWKAIRSDPAMKAWLPHHLSALYGAGVMERREVAVDGPRGVAYFEGEVVVAGYFSGDLIELDADTLELRRRISLGEQPPMDDARRGEMIFHDARFAFQRWLSCSSCHPDGRADGLNWDLLNDGIGNQKNAKSLLWTWQTPPAMSTGVRPDWEAAVMAGMQHFQLLMAQPEDVRALKAYLASMEPEASPHLAEDGRLTAAAARGKLVFERQDVGCAYCHGAPLYTNLRKFEVGTGTQAPGIADDPTDEYDTPTLIELWRSGPYLHDGRAATIRDVLTTHNLNDRHGRTSGLTAQELDDLEAYLLSL